MRFLVAVFCLGTAVLGAQVLVLGTGVREDLECFIRESKQQIDLQLPCLNDEGLEKALAQAVSQGAKVRILLSPYFKANRAAAGRLKGLGMEIRWVDANARLAISDSSKVALGSFNGLPDSLDKRVESLFIQKDDALAEDLTGSFGLQWEAAQSELPESLILNDQLEALPVPQEPGDKEPHLKTKRRNF